MSNDSEPRFSADQPISDRHRDLLNRFAFADRIAELLDHLPTKVGLVVGIFGPWGSGKTTVLNLLRSGLRKNDSVVVRDFNPWRLTDESKIFPSFFSVLSDAIKKRPSTKMERLRDWVGRRWRQVWKVIKLILRMWKPSVADVADELLKAFGAVAAAGDSVELEIQRNEIVHQLRHFNKRIVVLVDDIDRLDKGETQLLFRVIKACADFPNVCYILAFDYKMVAKAIGERYGAGSEESGRKFLGKIVQVPIELPPPAREDLRKLTLDQLNTVVACTGLKLTDAQGRELVTEFDPVIGSQLTTPRDAKRLRNELMFTVPPLVGEAHPVDLLLIEVVRVFFPDVYSIVSSNHNDFSGIEDERSQRDTDQPRCVARLEGALKDVDHAAVVQEILKGLFPRLHGGYNNIGYDTGHLAGVVAGAEDQFPRVLPKVFHALHTAQ